MLGRIAGAVRFKEPLSFHTSLRIGGPAEFFVVPQDIYDVRHALLFAEQEGLPVVVLGAGNNLLISERGIQAVVLKLQGVLSRSEFHGEDVVAGAGVSLSGLIREAAAQNLGGLEALAGIPATIGGALATNGGTAEASIADLCSAVYFLHPDGTLGELRPTPRSAENGFNLPAATVLVGCRFRLTRRPQAKILKDVQQRLKVKKTKHPFALAAAGYVWKNPPGHSAERLIENAGLKGKRVNGAEISQKSGNFVLNRGGATAADVLALMEMARDRVESLFGIALEPQIRRLGFEPAWGIESRPLEMAAAR